MNLSHHLFPECILTQHKATSRDELLTQQVNLIHAHFRKRKIPSPSAEAMLTEVLRRENQQGTCLGEGIAVPHARMESIAALGLSIALLAKPVPFSNGATQDVSISILVIAPIAEANLVLKIWGTFIRLLSDPGIRTQLQAAATPEDACNHLRAQNLAMELSLSARDLMVRPFFTIHPETPIREVTFLMDKHREVATAVVDKTGHLLGEVTSDRIFQFGMPEFFTQLQSVSFIRHFNPLEKYFMQEAELTAQNLMTDDCSTVSPSATLVEVIFQLIVKNRSKVYVTGSDKKLLGVIGRLSVLNRAINF